MDYPLNDVKGSFYTVKFENDTEKDLLRNDKNELTEDIVKAHKISGTFDFTGVTQSELVQLFLCSTTSTLKMYQNNILKGMKEKEILELAKTPQDVKVREMLDGRSSKILTDDEYRARYIAKQKKAGKTPEQIKADLQLMIDDLEASM